MWQVEKCIHALLLVANTSLVTGRTKYWDAVHTLGGICLT
jgi:hypothetical protein